SALIALVIAQIVARKFHLFLYWATIVASTTFGTTMADFATRSLGIGYTGVRLPYGRARSLVLVRGIDFGRVGQLAKGRSLLLGRRLLFHRHWAPLSATGSPTRRPVFGAGLAVAAAPDVSCVLLFWTAFILPRPLGATLGDFLDKALSHGGLALSRPIAS